MLGLLTVHAGGRETLPPSAGSAARHAPVSGWPVSSTAQDRRVMVIAAAEVRRPSVPPVARRRTCGTWWVEARQQFLRFPRSHGSAPYAYPRPIVANQRGEKQVCRAPRPRLFRQSPELESVRREGQSAPPRGSPTRGAGNPHSIECQSRISCIGTRRMLPLEVCSFFEHTPGSHVPDNRSHDPLN